MDNLERLKAMWRTDACSLRVEALRWAIEQLEWQPIDTAPKDGTVISSMNSSGDEDLIFWEEETRCCMGGPRAGSQPDGWSSVLAGGLPVDEIIKWKPEPAND